MQNHDKLPIDKGRRESLKKKMMVSAIWKKIQWMIKNVFAASPSSSKSILSKLNLDTIIDVITTVANQKYHHYSSRFLEGNLKVMTHFKNYSMDTKG